MDMFKRLNVVLAILTMFVWPAVSFALNVNPSQSQDVVQVSVSLAQAIDFAEQELHARAVSAELEHDDGQLVYMIELIDGDGREIEAVVDTQRLHIIEIEDEQDEDNVEGH